MNIVLLIILLMIVVAALPNWGVHDYGYAPSGIGGIVLLIILILLLSGRV